MSIFSDGLDAEKPIQIGSAKGVPGEISYGWFDIVELPTGSSERLPVIICQGRESGPVFWITAGIHGNELTGVPAIFDTINADLARQLRGTVIAIPSLNPSGLLTGKRQPFYSPGDPNRTFPGFKKKETDNEDASETSSVYEEAMERLFASILATADFLIDLHCYSLQSTPFTIRDRVFYKSEANKSEAESLLQKTDEMIRAFGLPVVNEFLAGKYFDQKLHRSTSGAALNEARIPSFTVELASSDMVVPAPLEAAKRGILNTLKWAGMLEGKIEPNNFVPRPEPGFPVKRSALPKAPNSGLIRYHVRPGDLIQKGSLIATLHDIFGRPLSKGPSRIISEHEGWVISLQQGLMCYQGQAVLNLAVRDDEPMIVPFPES